MRRLLLAVGSLLFLLPGCTADEASPLCYSGVVLGSTCPDGVLIQVTSTQPVGRPVRFHQTYRDSIVGSNVIAAVNDLGTLNKVGQTVYFTYAAIPNNQGPLRACTANTIPLAVPHLILANLSGEACASTR